jgi:hypothetical protein
LIADVREEHGEPRAIELVHRRATRRPTRPPPNGAYVGNLESVRAKYLHQRLVEDGKSLITAGVSAGIDGGLYLARRLVGEDAAKLIQRGIEYEPQPTHPSGLGCDLLAAHPVWHGRPDWAPP